MTAPKTEIAILDFGSQYTHLIARRIRELGVLSHIYPTDIPASELSQAAGIILSGGPRSVIRDAVIPYDKKLFALDVPILGLCYGHQLIGKLAGGTLQSGSGREYGIAEITTSSSPLFKNIPKKTTVWMSHGDYVAALPPGFSQIASTPNASITAMANEAKRWYGLQFHPEVSHSVAGTQMLKNFVFTICGATKNWTNTSQLTQLEHAVALEATGKKVFLLVSGGVDSVVCFALLEKVLGKDRVYGLHIDHGFMRHEETSLIVKSLKKLGFDNLHIYHAEQEFFRALNGVSDPEEKRRIIGNLFLDITDRLMKKQGKFGNDWLLGQGTIYPDTIESGGTKQSVVIKTHHNRVPAIQQMIAEGKIIEPIKELYKDEVRMIGRELGLPAAVVERQPFPGPGLAIRLLCSPDTNKTKPEPVTISTTNTSPFHFFQLPVRSVGVQGDERSYAHPGLLIAKKEIDTKILKQAIALAPTLTNEHKQLNRALLLAHGESASIAKSYVKKSGLTKRRVRLLQRLDYVVQRTIREDKLEKKIWQFPVVLLPFGCRYFESVVLRPVESAEAMTINAALLPIKTLQKIVRRVARLRSVDFVFYDLTNKPPGTIEWE